jgi:hypothetical protein
MLNKVPLKHTHAACASICATRTNTPRKLTTAWCHDHVVCRTRSAHEGVPFNEQKGQEFIFFWLLLPDPVNHVRRAKGARTAEERIRARSRSRTRRGHLLLTAVTPAEPAQACLLGRPTAFLDFCGARRRRPFAPRKSWGGMACGKGGAPPLPPWMARAKVGSLPPYRDGGAHGRRSRPFAPLRRPCAPPSRRTIERAPACRPSSPFLRVSPAGCAARRQEANDGTGTINCINAARVLATRQISGTLHGPTRAPPAICRGRRFIGDGCPTLGVLRETRLRARPASHSAPAPHQHLRQKQAGPRVRRADECINSGVQRSE